MPPDAGGLSLRKQALLPNQTLGFGVSRGGPAPRVLGKSSLRHGIGILLFGLRHVTVVFWPVENCWSKFSCTIEQRCFRGYGVETSKACATVAKYRGLKGVIPGIGVRFFEHSL